MSFENYKEMDYSLYLNLLKISANCMSHDLGETFYLKEKEKEKKNPFRAHLLQRKGKS